MSLIGNREKYFKLQELRQRIVADFRDTRFTWGGFLRWAGIVLAAFLFAAIVTLYFLDWNQMRGPISRYASNRLGREVRIDGDLKVDLFRWQPHVEVNGLYFGNPSWVLRPEGASIRHAVVEFRLVPAIFGRLILPLVQLDDGRALVVRDPSGRSNWDSKTSGPTAAWHIPPIRRFMVSNGQVEIDDQVRKLRFLGTISSEERAGRSGNAFQLKGDGTLNGNKFLADIHGGPLLNVDENKPYEFAADITAGDTHGVLNGSITHPFHLDEFSAGVTMTGKNLADLYFLTGLALPSTPPYRLTARLMRFEALYRLRELNGSLGASDLQGDLSIDVAGERPMLRGSLKSRVLNFDDLGALFGGGKQNPGQAAYLLPDTALHTERLRQMDADVSYSADAINSRDLPLRGLVTHITIDKGVLTLKPLSFAFSQGRLSGTLRIDARRDIPQTSVDARITDIHIENFIKGAEKPLSGLLEARASLTGRGNSVHKVAATSNGTVTAVIPSGKIRHSIAEWLGINVLSALSLTLSGDESDTGLRCAVVHFGAKSGVLTTRQFVIDTDPVLVQGDGAVNLGRENLELRLQGKPKQFQLFRARAPILVSGSLQSPKIGVDATPLITQGAIGVGLAALNPFAAILAFIDPGLAKDANCAGLMGTAKAQGAPVTNKQVTAGKGKS